MAARSAEGKAVGHRQLAPDSSRAEAKRVVAQGNSRVAGKREIAQASNQAEAKQEIEPARILSGKGRRVTERVTELAAAQGDAPRRAISIAS